MSDTIQTVRWSLDSGQEQHMWLSGGRELPDDVLRESIRRTQLEPQLRESFACTDPPWYGFWIDSPLTVRQCELLHCLFADMIAQVPRYGVCLAEFMTALTTATTQGHELRVELATPGHVDCGFVTTFVHCPRCKAEGPLKRWQKSYSEEAIPCPVCGHEYSPAATHSTQPDYFAEFVRCSDCRESYRLKGLSDAEIGILENEHHYREAVEEWSWLQRVARFYWRYPHLKDRIVPHFMHVSACDDPQVKDDLYAGVPLDQIFVPEDPELADQPDWTEEDRVVAEYLRHHYFSLPARMQSVREFIREREPGAKSDRVRCPKCGGSIRAHVE